MGTLLGTPMRTKHIGIKKLRQELFKVFDELERPGNQYQYKVLRNNKPIALLTPVVWDGDDYFTAEDIASIKRGEEDVRRGRTYTPEEVFKDLEKRWPTKSATRRKQKKN